jgi:hypothetical protein
MTNLNIANKALPTDRDSFIEHSAKIGALLAALLPSAFSVNELNAQENRPAAASPASISQESVVLVNNVKQVVRQWNSNHNLYVQGDIGVNEQTLHSLAAWLKAEHPNWTVYLAAQCANERMIDREGKLHKGSEAVEFCLGQELFNATAFGSLKDARTGESNGAIIYITFDSDPSNRKVGYFASEAYDLRGLGEAAWKNGFDTLAINKLQQGRQVLLAVVAPITKIDAQLNDNIAQEQERKEHALKTAQHISTQMNSDLELIENQIATFRNSHPDLSGDLSHPDRGPLKNAIDSVQGLTKLGKFSEIEEIDRSFKKNAQTLTLSLQNYEGAPQLIENLRTQAIQFSESHTSAMAESIQLIKESLDNASREHSLGNSSYQLHIEKAEKAVAEARQKLSSIETLEATLSTFLGILYGALALGVGVQTYLSYRQRRETQADAKELIKKWTTALDEKIDRLFALDETKTLLFGKDLSDKRFSGDTQALAEEIIQDIGNLFVLGSSARKVLAEAIALVEPKETWSKVINLFTRGKFEEARELLTKTPIVFNPESRIELILNGPKDKQLGLIGELSDYQPFSISFDDLISGFNQRAKSTLNKMDSLQSQQLSLPEQIESTARSLKKLAETTIPAVLVADVNLTQVLDKHGEDLKIITDRLYLDPTGAAKELKLLNTRIECTETVVKLINSIQEPWGIPQIEGLSVELSNHGIDTAWITNRYTELSQELESLLHEQIVKKEFSLRIIDFREQVDLITMTLSEITTYICKLEETEKSLELLADDISATRKELCKNSGVNRSLLLKEPLADIDPSYASAQNNCLETRTTLSNGRFDNCSQTLQLATNTIASMREVLRQSVTSQSSYTAFRQNCLHQLDAFRERLPKMNQLLIDMKEQYGRQSFRQKLEWQTRPLAPDTIEFNVIEIDQTLLKIKTLLANTDNQYARGEFIATLETRATINVEIMKAHDRIEEIIAHHERLKEVQHTNQETAALLASRHDAAKQAIARPTTSPESKRLYQHEKPNWKQNLKLALKEKNPITQMGNLDILNQSVARIEASISKDEQAYHNVKQGIEKLSNDLKEFADKLDIARLSSSPPSLGMNLLMTAQDEINLELQRHASLVKKPHQEWQELESEQQQIYVKIVELRSQLKKEEETIVQALASLKAAEKNIKKVGELQREAKTATRAIGQVAYDTALQALARGDYLLVLELSNEATMASKTTLAEINTQVNYRKSNNSSNTSSSHNSSSDSTSHTPSSYGSSSSSSHSSYDSGSSSSYGSSSSGFSSSGFDGGSGFSSSGW